MKKDLNSVFDLEWNPRIFIEASAGTGKRTPSSAF